jgi:hypothetical protein
MAWTKTKTALIAGAAILFATGTVTVVVKTATSGAWPFRANPSPDQIRKVNVGLPTLQVEAKTLIFSAFALRRVPDAANWCETLNASAKLWPATTRSTAFALNAQVAGRALSTLPPDTVIFFEAAKAAWNQAGGPELLVKKEEGAAVAFADGRALVVDPGHVAGLRWAPQ